MTSLSNSQDVIDSRDVIARIAELEDMIEDDHDDNGGDDGLDEDDRAELDALQSLADEATGYGDWSHGETLIRHSYFIEYAQELAHDIGAIDLDVSWPACHIDWDDAAKALQMDYMSVDFDGVEYWMRA